MQQPITSNEVATTDSLPLQRVELDVEISRLAAIRDACVETLDEEQWQASAEAEETIRQLERAIASGKYPTGDELEGTVKEVTSLIREKVRNESVAAARPLREKLLYLQASLAREREAEARVRNLDARKTSENGAAQTPTRAVSQSHPPLHSTLNQGNPAAVSDGMTFPVAAMFPFPPYNSFDELTPVHVDYSYRNKKNFLKSGRQHRGGTKIDLDDERFGFVTINAYRLNESQIQWFLAEFNIALRPDKYYWYDKASGFFGEIGEKTSCTIDPWIPLMGDLHRLSSVGRDGPESGVVINGRSIDCFELDDFHKCGMENLVKGQEYSIGPDGSVRVTHEPGFPTPPILYNWRDKVGNPHGPPLHQLPQSNSRNNGDNSSTSTNGQPRPPPPPYQAPSSPQTTDLSQLPGHRRPAPPPYHPPQQDRPLSNNSPVLRRPQAPNPNQHTNASSSSHHPPNPAAEQPSRPPRNDAPQRRFTLNVQLGLGGRDELQAVTQPREPMGIGTEVAHGDAAETLCIAQQAYGESTAQCLHEAQPIPLEGFGGPPHYEYEIANDGPPHEPQLGSNSEYVEEGMILW
jgi:hypothetical protein